MYVIRSGLVINLFTVCTDSYPIIYANKLHKRFSDVTELDVNHYCITDKPDDLLGMVTPIAPFFKSKGWWNKLNLYSNSMPSGFILYMDLDIVIIKNFDLEILEMTNREEKMCCVSDAVNWMGNKFSSSLMLFKSGAHNHIFNKFVNDEKLINNNKGGDQVWTGPQLDSVYYVDESYPNLKKNLKFHLSIPANDPNKLNIPINLSNEIKLVDCGGRPKPHELKKLPYIKDNWHDITF